MLHIYLPIAEVSISALVLIGLGALVGVLSGLFGVGGGFILTPLLFFVGVPPAVAVGTQGNLIAASSFSGMLDHMRRRTVDRRMGLVLLAGGVIGSALGVRAFRLLREMGQVDLVVRLSYVGLLGVIGALMFAEAARALARRRAGRPLPQRRRHSWVHGLPLRMRFPVSRLYISVIPPLVVGVLVGVMAAIMGVGGGFLMIPAMIYLIGMPTKVVIGTSLFQITLLSGFTTVMHAVENHDVDVVLAFILILGGVIGAQIGSRLGARLQADTLRFALAALVLAIALAIGWGLVATPDELYQIG